MKPISSVYFLVLLPFLFSHFHRANAKGLIQKACESSSYKDLCVENPQSNSASEGAKLCGLGKITLKNATTNAITIQKQISQMQVIEELKKSLTDCKENYDNTLSRSKNLRRP